MCFILYQKLYLQIYILQIHIYILQNASNTFYMIHFIDMKTEYKSYKAITSLTGVRLRSIQHSRKPIFVIESLPPSPMSWSSRIYSMQNETGKSHESGLREMKGRKSQAFWILSFVTHSWDFHPHIKSFFYRKPMRSPLVLNSTENDSWNNEHRTL